MTRSVCSLRPTCPSVRVLALLAALLLPALAPRPAAGFVTLKHGSVEPTWPHDDVRYYIHTAGSQDVTAAELDAAIQAAFQAWQDVPCARIRFTYGGRRSSDPGDGIFIRFQESNWDPSVDGAAAYAMSWKNWRGEITHAEVVFNGQDSTWTTDAAEANWGYASDIQGVGAHEIGHTLGLDHTRDITATMFYSSSGNAEMRTLEPDDERGACYLYPTSSFTQGAPCDSCTEDGHCAEGDCLNYGAPDYFCGKDCANDTDCPDGYYCYTRDGVNSCVPENGYCNDAGENQPMGADCWGYEVCEPPLVCLPLQGEAYCTRTCTTSCPASYQCLSGYCLRGGSGQMGDPCGTNWDCESMVCAEAGPGRFVCSKACTATAQCPGARCVDGFCFRPGDRPIGADCEGHDQCQSSLCAGHGARFCTVACTPGDDSPCHEGSTCTSEGYCTKPPAMAGDPCKRAADCPAGHFCLFSGPGVPEGVCAFECTPYREPSGCSAGEVCAWAEMGWLNQLKGACAPPNGGGSVGDSCAPGAPPCERDLACVAAASGPVCYRDCRLPTGQGCEAGETCQPLGDSSAPTRGYCFGTATQPEPGRDVQEPPRPDAVGPGRDTGVSPRPDTSGGGADGLSSDGGSLTGADTSDEGPGQPGSGGGGGGGCAAAPDGVPGGGALPIAGLLLLGVGVVLGGRFARRPTVQSKP